jgi:hypothetical protein
MVIISSRGLDADLGFDWSNKNNQEHHIHEILPDRGLDTVEIPFKAPGIDYCILLLARHNVTGTSEFFD